MKKTIYLLALFSGLFLASPPASAVNDPLDYRRTLFVPLAGTTLFFEAPEGMCFVDPTKDDRAEQMSSWQSLPPASAFLRP